MSISFRECKVEMYEGHKGGPFSKSGSVQFDHSVKNAEAVMKGFDICFANSEHPIKEIGASVSNVQFNGRTVTFSVTIAMRDNTGNFDDGYYGSFTVMVIADVSGN